MFSLAYATVSEKKMETFWFSRLGICSCWSDDSELFFLEGLHVPKRIENKNLCKTSGADVVFYGEFENSRLEIGNVSFWAKERSGVSGEKPLGGSARGREGERARTSDHRKLIKQRRFQWATHYNQKWGLFPSYTTTWEISVIWLA